MQPLSGRGQTFFSVPANTPRTDAATPDQVRSLELFGPPVIVMREDGTIVHRLSSANSLTEDLRRMGAANIFDVARNDAHARLRQAIQRCTQLKRREDELAVPFVTASGDVSVDLTLRSYRELAQDEDLITLTCDLPERSAVPDPALADGVGHGTIEALQQELAGRETRLRDSLESAQSST